MYYYLSYYNLFLYIIFCFIQNLVLSFYNWIQKDLLKRFKLSYINKLVLVTTKSFFNKLILGKKLISTLYNKNIQLISSLISFQYLLLYSSEYKVYKKYTYIKITIQSYQTAFYYSTLYKHSTITSFQSFFQLYLLTLIQLFTFQTISKVFSIRLYTIITTNFLNTNPFQNFNYAFNYIIIITKENYF